VRWMLVERKPGVIHAGRLDRYLSKNGEQTYDRGSALTFETREAAEAYRRLLPHRYAWVATTAED
jgi:hypothetical protein